MQVPTSLTQSVAMKGFEQKGVAQPVLTEAAVCASILIVDSDLASNGRRKTTKNSSCKAVRHREHRRSDFDGYNFGKKNHHCSVIAAVKK